MIIHNFVTLILIICIFYTWALDNNVRENLECSGKQFRNVNLAAYYPNYDDEDSTHNYLDVRGKKLNNLQDYLDDRASFVTIAMDQKLLIPYGTVACIPELNKHLRRRIALQVRDNNSDLLDKNYTSVDICVRSETDSYDKMVNRIVTLVF